MHETAVSVSFPAAPAPVGRRPAEARRDNRAAVMTVLRSCPAGRAELARRLGLSKTALSDLTQDLLSQGLVSEQGRVPVRRGRHPAPLQVHADRAAVIALDLAITGVNIGVYDLAGTQRSLERLPSAWGQGTGAVYAGVLSGVRRAQAQAQTLGLPVAAVGVAAPGPLDAEAGVILDPPMFRELRDFPILARLEADLGLPVRLERDSTAAAGAHLRFSGANDFIYLLMLEHGIGGGLVLGGRVYRGVHGYAGEVGHISLDVHGPRCPCGNRGCLERLADARAVLSAYVAAGGRPVGFGALTALAHAGDTRARTVLADAGRAFGLAAVNLVNLFDPQALVLGGLAAPAAPFMMPGVRAVLSERAYPHLRWAEQLSLVACGLQDPVLQGAAESVLNALYCGDLGMPPALPPGPPVSPLPAQPPAPPPAVLPTAGPAPTTHRPGRRPRASRRTV